LNFVVQFLNIASAGSLSMFLRVMVKALFTIWALLSCDIVMV